MLVIKENNSLYFKAIVIWQMIKLQILMHHIEYQLLLYKFLLYKYKEVADKVYFTPTHLSSPQR